MGVIRHVDAGYDHAVTSPPSGRCASRWPNSRTPSCSSPPLRPLRPSPPLPPPLCSLPGGAVPGQGVAVPGVITDGDGSFIARLLSHAAPAIAPGGRAGGRDAVLAVPSAGDNGRRARALVLQPDPMGRA